MGATAAIVGAVGAVAGAGASVAAASAQNKAQKKAASFERARAGVNRQREIRRAIAARRLQEAEFIQAGETQGGGTNSAIAGAVGSLRTQTAANIGLTNTNFATSIAQSKALQRGATRSTRFQNIGSAFDAAGSLGFSLSNNESFIKKFG